MKKISYIAIALLLLGSCSKKDEDQNQKQPENPVTPVNPNNPVTPPASASLKTYLLERYDTDKNGELSMTEVASVTTLDVSGRGLTDLDGLEALTQLETLRASKNKLTQVTFKSENRNLAAIYLNNNNLVKLDISNLPYMGMLPSDISGNPRLTCVNAGGRSTAIKGNREFRKDAHTEIKENCN